MTIRIDLPHETIAAFCRTNGIEEFSLFGSVLRDDFRPDSDIDVLIRFSPGARHTLFDLMHMEDQLAAIFQRPAHIVTEPGVRNPYLRRSILQAKEVIYDTCGLASH
jgi:hypothetical protein